jgi:hypothetical protein
MTTLEMAGVSIKAGLSLHEVKTACPVFGFTITLFSLIEPLVPKMVAGTRHS